MSEPGDLSRWAAALLVIVLLVLALLAARAVL